MSEKKHAPLSDTIHNLKVVREALEAEGLTVHIKLIDQAIEDISAAPQVALGPVAWLYETWCGEDHWSQRYSDTKPSNDSWIRNVRPLYLGAPHTQAESAQDREIEEVSAWVESIGRITPEIRQRILDAVARYDKCRDDRPLVFTMRNDDQLTVGDLRSIAIALSRPHRGGDE